jgi:hypothetical protein
MVVLARQHAFATWLVMGFVGLGIACAFWQ